MHGDNTISKMNAKRFLRKCIAGVLAGILFLSILGCQSAAARDADQLISKIGEVTRNSQEAIQAARTAVSGLTEKEKESLKNLSVLEQAEAEYQTVLVFSAVEDLITEIGEINTESEEKIKKAKEAYANLDPSLQSRVSNYQVLLDSETKYYQLLASAIDADIEAIGEVNRQSGTAIEKARKSYDAATDEVKQYVSKYAELEKAEASLKKAKAEYVVSLIEGIGKVSLNSASAVKTARGEYNKLSRDEMNLVTNLSVLQEAETELRKLEDEDAVKKVEEAIEAIGTVTLDSASAIEAAEKSYNGLTTQRKSMVTNYSVLTAAKARLEELRKQEYESAVSRTRQEEDKVNRTTFYLPDAMPRYTNSRSYLLPYIGMRDNYFWIKLRFLFTGDSWIFFEKAHIVVDGKKYTKTFNYFDLTRDNDYGDVWEYVDMNVKESDIKILQSIVDSDETIVRFEGDHYYYDITVSSGDKSAIKDILIMYEYLKKTKSFS